MFSESVELTAFICEMDEATVNRIQSQFNEKLWLKEY